MQYRKSVFRSLAMVTQLGLCVITPVLFCVFIGYQVDHRFGTGFMMPLLILGVLGGGRGAWQMAKRTLLEEQKEDEQIRQAGHAENPRTGISKPKEPSRIRKDEAEVKEVHGKAQKGAGDDGMAQ